MKKVSIISFFDIYQSQGVNHVTSDFLQGQDLLNKRGYELYRLYYPKGYLDAKKYKILPQFDSSSCDKCLHKRSRVGIYSLINKILNIKNPFIEWMKMYYTIYLNAKRVMNNFQRNDNNDTDIVIFQGYPAAYISSKLDGIVAKKICIMHTGNNPLDYLEYTNYALFNSKYYKRKLLTHIKNATIYVDHLVVLSKAALNSFSWIADNKKTIIYNGIVQSKPIQAQQIHTCVNFVTVASLQKRKGQDLLINAISLLPDDIKEKVHFNFVGDGPDLKSLKHLVQELNLTEYITFWGNRSDVPRILCEMDIFILASNSEGLPISIIEALRQGLYIMTTNVGGCPDMIDYKSGMIIPNSIEGIKRSIIKVLESGDYLHCSQHCIQRFNALFSLNAMMNNYANLFDSL